MLIRRIVAGVAIALLAVTFAWAGEELKSGPQVGQKVPGPFHPLNVNGESAGQKVCLYCKNGENPVAMVFARESSEPLTQLIKKLDTCTEKNSGCSMGSFVVFLSDKEGLEKELKEVADNAKLKHIVLSIDNPAGPKGYNVAKDADVTVVLYKERKVVANHSFKKGELSAKAIEQVVGDVAKITK